MKKVFCFFNSFDYTTFKIWVKRKLICFKIYIRDNDNEYHDYQILHYPIKFL